MALSARKSSVRDHIPLEQGLRLPSTAPDSYDWIRQRPYSIRTRIKTFLLFHTTNNFFHVRDHIPLEQGLRPTITVFIKTPEYVRDHIPLEQGLRHLQYWVRWIILVRDHIPLEQGLRQPLMQYVQLMQIVRDHIPLEQGLRRCTEPICYLLAASETIFH